jgi:hypothetical protein
MGVEMIAEFLRTQILTVVLFYIVFESIGTELLGRRLA